MQCACPRGRMSLPRRRPDAAASRWRHRRRRPRLARSGLPDRQDARSVLTEADLVNGLLVPFELDDLLGRSDVPYDHGLVLRSGGDTPTVGAEAGVGRRGPNVRPVWRPLAGLRFARPPPWPLAVDGLIHTEHARCVEVGGDRSAGHGDRDQPEPQQDRYPFQDRRQANLLLHAARMGSIKASAPARHANGQGWRLTLSFDSGAASASGYHLGGIRPRWPCPAEAPSRIPVLMAALCQRSFKT